MGIATTSNKLVTTAGLLLRRADEATSTGAANDAGIANKPNASAAASAASAFAVAPTITTGSGQSFAAYTASILAERKGFAVTGDVTGGAAGQVYVVTSTADSGVGTLRDACSGSNRWIVFSRAVFPKTTETTIQLSSPINILGRTNLTIDGFGARVRVAGYGFATASFAAPPTGATAISNNLVFLNVKVANVTVGAGFDCINCMGTDRMWLYHCDLSGGGDGNLDIMNTFAGPNANGYMTIQNCYLHDTNRSGGTNCLIGDQTTPDGLGSDYGQASSSFPGGNGGDNRITIVDSRFKDRQRNPVVANYWVHMYNNYVHGYTVHGPSVMGLMGHLRGEYNVIDGTGAGANAFKGFDAWTFSYPDNSKKYKRWALANNMFLGGATASDGSSGFLNPAGSIFTIPYSYTPEVVTSDSGAALIARLASTNLATQGRAGCIDRNGYFDLVT